MPPILPRRERRRFAGRIDVNVLEGRAGIIGAKVRADEFLRAGRIMRGHHQLSRTVEREMSRAPGVMWRRARRGCVFNVRATRGCDRRE